MALQDMHGSLEGFPFYQPRRVGPGDYFTVYEDLETNLAEAQKSPKSVLSMLSSRCLKAGTFAGSLSESVLKSSSVENSEVDVEMNVEFIGMNDNQENTEPDQIPPASLPGVSGSNSCQWSSPPTARTPLQSRTNTTPRMVLNALYVPALLQGLRLPESSLAIALGLFSTPEDELRMPMFREQTKYMPYSRYSRRMRVEARQAARKGKGPSASYQVTLEEETTTTATVANQDFDAAVEDLLARTQHLSF